MMILPRARALVARMRRPLMPVAAGAVLLLPAAALMNIQPPSGSEEDSSEDRLVAWERERTDPYALQYRERLVEHERDLVVASFAKEFGVSKPLARDIYAAAVAEGIEPRMAFGLVRAESSFRPRVVSSAGAVGLTQVLPSTARWMVPGTTRRDLMEPGKNLKIGFKYLNYLMEKFDGDEQLALTAYNRGPGTVNRLLKRGRDPDNGYAGKVLN